MSDGDKDDEPTGPQKSDCARADAARKGSPFLNSAQAAHFLGLSLRTLEDMRERGDGPLYRKHGRQVRYHIADLETWSAAHVLDPKADRKPHGKKT